MTGIAIPMKQIVALGWILVFPEDKRQQVLNTLLISQEDFELLEPAAQADVKVIRQCVELLNQLHNLYPYPSADKKDYVRWIIEGCEEFSVFPNSQSEYLLYFCKRWLGADAI